MSHGNQSALWQSRAKLILQVQAGALSAKEASRQMGVSRKTYYEWEKRALSGMADALSNGNPGRPENPRDLEKEQLRDRIDNLEKDLLLAKQTVEVRDMLKLIKKPGEPAKKNRKSRNN